MIKPLASWDADKTLKTFYTDTYMGLFQGRTMQKCADDLDRYTEVIADTVPDVVIETGTRYGGSALWFHEQGIEVISIDTDAQVDMQARANDRVRDIQYLVGSSIDPAVVSTVREMTKGKRVMVSLDSDHHANHVWQEITLYGPLVTQGCFMVVEDACFDTWVGEDARRGGRRIPEEGGPLKAIRLAGLEIDPRWKRDEDIEGWTDISHSPCGWWEKR